MQVWNDIAQVVIFFGSGLCFLMAFEQVSGRVRDKVSVIAFALLFCNGLIILQTGLAVDMIQERYPSSTFLFTTALYCLGPLNLFYYHSLLDPELPIPYKTLLHILPALPVFLFELVFLAQPFETRQGIIELMFTDPLQSPLAVVILAGAALIFAYLVYLSKIELSLWKGTQIRTEIGLIAGVNLMAKASIIVLVLGLLLLEKSLLMTGGLLLTGIHVAIFLAHSRYPQFFQRIRMEIRKKRYEKSLLTGLNTELVHTRLMEVMREGEIYKDMELSLSTLADELSLTPHQLSQFLNERLGLDFRSFINAYRVEEAKRMLVERPGEGILTICFEVGFNSKSTFNTVFKKITGCTPSEFRSKGGINSPL